MDTTRTPSTGRQVLAAVLLATVAGAIGYGLATWRAQPREQCAERSFDKTGRGIDDCSADSFDKSFNKKICCSKSIKIKNIQTGKRDSVNTRRVAFACRCATALLVCACGSCARCACNWDSAICRADAPQTSVGNR